MTEGAAGILGGTFDPIHNGHIGLALDVRAGLPLDAVHLIPAGDPPHRERPIASAQHRLAMVIEACIANPGLVADDREVRKTGASFTVDTLRELRAEMGPKPLALILGADAFVALEQWHRWQELFLFAHVVVADRPGATFSPATLTSALREEWQRRYRAGGDALAAAPAGTIVRQAIRPHGISSTAIRRALASGPAGRDKVRGLLPPGVLDYIDRNQLYRHPDAA